MTQLTSLQEKIGYSFHDEELLKWALTHSSYYNEHRKELKGHNERLEFLGDSVLEMVSSEYLFLNHKTMPEGEMTKLRASKVCEPALAMCARLIDLPEYIFLGKGECKNGGRERDSIVSDALEAVIGALYLDGGFDNAKEFILKHIMYVQEDNEVFCDSKTRLQEAAQKRFGSEPQYVVVNSSGPENDPTFEVVVYLFKAELGRGIGKSKKDAEQAAAKIALNKLKDNGDSECI